VNTLMYKHEPRREWVSDDDVVIKMRPQRASFPKSTSIRTPTAEPGVDWWKLEGNAGGVHRELAKEAPWTSVDWLRFAPERHHA
jgi:hypothetical protein